MPDTPPTPPSTKKQAMKKLVGQAMVAGAMYAGKRLTDNDSQTVKPKKSHKLRNLVGLVAVAGAAYAGSRIMANKKVAAKKKQSN